MVPERAFFTCLLSSTATVQRMLRLKQGLKTQISQTRCQSCRVRGFHYSRPWSNEQYDPTTVERVEDEVDVCIVGAGPAGLSAAIRIKQLEREKGKDVRVVVVEKGSEVGAMTCPSAAADLLTPVRRCSYPFWSCT